MVPELFLHSGSGRPPLRVGILLDGFVLPRCFEQVIDHIGRSDFARIELVVVNAAAAGAAAAPRRPRWRLLLDQMLDSKLRKKLVYSLYQRWDSRRSPPENDPLGPVDCTARLAGVERIDVDPITKGFVHRIRPEDIEAIRARKLDVLLRFGFNILRGDILNAARFGIWSYHHGDNDRYRGGPPYFWELYERNPLSGVILQVLTEELDGGRVLAKAMFATTPGISQAQNRFTPYWGSMAMVIQKLRELHECGWERVQQRMLPAAPYEGKRKLYRTPANGELAMWLARSVAGALGRRVRRMAAGTRVVRWRIGLREGGEPLYQAGAQALGEFRWLDPPPGHFHADPFLVEADGRRWIFYEDYLYSTSRAALACRELLPGGAVGEPATVLERPFHLSYPFVFRHDGRFYMIPESRRGGGVELLRAEEFPWHWSPVKTLYRGDAADTTLVVEQGTFFFFTTLAAPFGEGRCLCLFWADRLDGDWHPHPLNPISMDVRHARSGGRVIRDGGRLIRVSQSGAGGYGSALGFSEITEFGRMEYAERPLAEVTPAGNGTLGVHSYDRLGSLDVIDGFTLEKAAGQNIQAKYAAPALEPGVMKV